MANTMQDYESWIAPTKRKVFSRLIKLHSLERFKDMEVLEVGIGTAPNLQYYAKKAAGITGLDPNPFMFDYATESAAQAGLKPEKLKLVEGLVEHMPFEDNSFDCVVCTLTLCSVLDPREALEEIKRVMRPGARLLFIEHVRSPKRGFVLGSQILLDPLQQRLSGNCHLTRRTGEIIESAGFSEVNMMDNFFLEFAGPISPHVSGIVTL